VGGSQLKIIHLNKKIMREEERNTSKLCIGFKLLKKVNNQRRSILRKKTTSLKTTVNLREMSLSPISRAFNFHPRKIRKTQLKIAQFKVLKNKHTKNSSKIMLIK
jgi:hypothetical protein